MSHCHTAVEEAVQQYRERYDRRQSIPTHKVTKEAHIAPPLRPWCATVRYLTTTSYQYCGGTAGQGMPCRAYARPGSKGRGQAFKLQRQGQLQYDSAGRDGREAGSGGWGGSGRARYAVGKAMAGPTPHAAELEYSSYSPRPVDVVGAWGSAVHARALWGLHHQQRGCPEVSSHPGVQGSHYWTPTPSPPGE